LEPPSSLETVSFSKNVYVLFHFLETQKLVTAAVRRAGGFQTGLTMGKATGNVECVCQTTQHLQRTQLKWFYTCDLSPSSFLFTEIMQGISLWVDVGYLRYFYVLGFFFFSLSS
jgi:hypothetical protein